MSPAPVVGPACYQTRILIRPKQALPPDPAFVARGLPAALRHPVFAVVGPGRGKLPPAEPAFAASRRSSPLPQPPPPAPWPVSPSSGRGTPHLSNPPSRLPTAPRRRPGPVSRPRAEASPASRIRLRGFLPLPVAAPGTRGRFAVPGPRQARRPNPPRSPTHPRLLRSQTHRAEQDRPSSYSPLTLRSVRIASARAFEASGPSGSRTLRRRMDAQNSRACSATRFPYSVRHA